MLTLEVEREYYKALLDKNSQYEGLFYVGVKTTGIFCRPTCPARKPKIENCEFFNNAKEALVASYRPCKRCQPLSLPNSSSDVIQKLIESVEKEPEKRWKDRDFASLSVDAVTVRRQFKRRFGMTFVEYARARRMGIAIKQIREGESVVDVQLSSGYESGSGFRDAFSKIMGKSPAFSSNSNLLKTSWIDTKLGPMIAIADENFLYLLEFADRRGLEREIERMRNKTKSAIVPGKTAPIESIEKELEEYFSGNLKNFKTPLKFLGSHFQQSVWKELMKIPYGTTISYLDLAKVIERPKSYRAVANANGANQLAIIIPCHRVINANGDMGGYGGGLPRKQWMLEFERGNS